MDCANPAHPRASIPQSFLVNSVGDSYQPHPTNSSRVSDQHLFQLLRTHGDRDRQRWRTLAGLLLSSPPSLASLLFCELLTGLNSSAQLSLSCPILKADMPLIILAIPGALECSWPARSPSGGGWGRRLGGDQLACLWPLAFCSWPYPALSSIELWRSSEYFFSH